MATLSIACWCGAVWGQSSGAESITPKPATVSVPFFVVDGHGNSNSGVSKDGVSVLDHQKRALPIETVHSAKEMPLRIGILIDVSRSAAHSDLYGPSVQAALDFLKEAMSGADDRAFLAMFDATPAATGLMTKDQISSFKLNLTSGGGTALYDAIYIESTQLMQPGPESSRRVLLILSDGDDNLSHVSREKATTAAQQAGTVLFAVDTGDYKNPKGRRVLDQMTEQTGGRVFDAMGRKDLEKVFASLGGLLSNMESVTFTPSEPAGSGNFHPIELRLTMDSKLKIRAPNGYYGSASTTAKP